MLAVHGFLQSQRPSSGNAAEQLECECAIQRLESCNISGKPKPGARAASHDMHDLCQQDSLLAHVHYMFTDGCSNSEGLRRVSACIYLRLMTGQSLSGNGGLHFRFCCAGSADLFASDSRDKSLHLPAQTVRQFLFW